MIKFIQAGDLLIKLGSIITIDKPDNNGLYIVRFSNGDSIMLHQDDLPRDELTDHFDIVNYKWKKGQDDG